MCGSDYPNYPNILPITLYVFFFFFSEFLSLKKIWSEKYNQTVYLVLEEKAFNNCVLNRTLFIATFSYFVHSKADLCI